jgi:hypothetical protein
VKEFSILRKNLLVSVWIGWVSYKFCTVVEATLSWYIMLWISSIEELHEGREVCIYAKGGPATIA